MLVIRHEQMKVLGDAMQRQFELRTLERLHRNFPKQLENRMDEELLTMIRRGISQAAGYGIVSQIDVTRYIEYMILYGPDFDSQLTRVGEILRTPGLQSAEKMDRIDDYDQFARNRE
jgi:hypothetical protein